MPPLPLQVAPLLLVVLLGLGPVGSAPPPPAPEPQPAPPPAPTTLPYYVAITLVGPSGKALARSLQRTMHTHLQVEGLLNTTIEPLLVLEEDGDRGGAAAERLCRVIGGRRLVGVLVVGGGHTGLTTTLAAITAGLPVLWAKDGEPPLYSLTTQGVSPSQVSIEPTGRETMGALRALLLAAHWHAFTIIADERTSSGVLLRPELGGLLRAPPLTPSVVRLPAQARSHTIFSKLADVSRLTRGVIVLMCEQHLARMVMLEAKRLNMVDGHFVFIWLDSRTRPDEPSSLASPANPTNPPPSAPPPPPPPPPHTINRRQIEIMGVDAATDWSTLGAGATTGFRGQRPTLWQHKTRAGELPRQAPRRVSPPPSASSTAPVAPPPPLPIGMLALRRVPHKFDKHALRGALRVLVEPLRKSAVSSSLWLKHNTSGLSCWRSNPPHLKNFTQIYVKELRSAASLAMAARADWLDDKAAKSLTASFRLLNLVPDDKEKDTTGTEGGSKVGGEVPASVPVPADKEVIIPASWRTVGRIAGRQVELDTIVWPGGDLVVPGLSARARSIFRVVTAPAPPFVMEGELDEDGQCLRGLPCHRLLTKGKDNLTMVFNRLETDPGLAPVDDDTLAAAAGQEADAGMGHVGDGLDGMPTGDASTTDDDDDNFGFDKFRFFMDQDEFDHPKYKYRTNCCYGLAMDLLENVAQELEFDFHLYVVSDGHFGSKTSSGAPKAKTWNGIVGDLTSGAAHMAFAALSVTSERSEVMDFSVPFFYSGVSFLAAPTQTSEIPLHAFLLPFSPELWIAIFLSLHFTALAVAVYEWHSPFGLNPWGRQRSKNFSISSALWVMWGLLCGHLVAFKAPKSWPNKFLINVWGGFSVLFVASYTANIAALIAGLFFNPGESSYHDRSLLSQHVGAPRHSAPDYYVHLANERLWQHMQPFGVRSVEEGVARLRNGSLDILIADTPILDYYRATDHGCKLQKIGEAIGEDSYAVGMAKGFPLKDSLSAVIAKYTNNGYMDILQEKWYGGLPCFKRNTDMAQPRPLGVAAVAGVFILLGVGVGLGCLILIFEHLFYRYTLPILRHQPMGTIWKSRNIMFFSQKLYRFINCVELVSPHHAARELVHTIRQGQITSLFQKSVKRKEHEQRRRRKSKAQFFEMIQEIRRRAAGAAAAAAAAEEGPTPAATSSMAGSDNPSGSQLAESTIDPSTAGPASGASTVLRFAASPDTLHPGFGAGGGAGRPTKSPSRLDFARRLSRELFSRSPRSEESFSAAASSGSLAGAGQGTARGSRTTAAPATGPPAPLAVPNTTSSGTRRFSCETNLSPRILKCAAIGRRLSRGNNSPPDINSRRASNLDVGNSRPPFSPMSGRSTSRLLSGNVGGRLAAAASDHALQQQLMARHQTDVCGGSPVIPSVSIVHAEVSDDSPSPSDNVFEPQPSTSRAPARSLSGESDAGRPPRAPKSRSRSCGSAAAETTTAVVTAEEDSTTTPAVKTPEVAAEADESIPPPPPPPQCLSRKNQIRDGKPVALSRLSREELVALWRSSESELRELLLSAIRDKDEEVTDPP